VRAGPSALCVANGDDVDNVRVWYYSGCTTTGRALTRGGVAVSPRKKGDNELNGFEPYLKPEQIMKAFGMSYGFLNSHSKRDETDPNRPIMPHKKMGRVSRYRLSEVEQYLSHLESYNRSRKP
jgi:hypothetical protein